MSEGSSAASGTILIADFVNVDAAGKVNIIGGGIQYLGFDPENELTAPFAVFVNVTVNIPSLEDTMASVEVLLVDTDGQPVSIHGPDGSNTMRFEPGGRFPAYQRRAPAGAAHGLPRKFQHCAEFSPAACR